MLCSDPLAPADYSCVGVHERSFNSGWGFSGYSVGYSAGRMVAEPDSD